MWFIHVIQCRLKTGTTKGRLMRLWAVGAGRFRVLATSVIQIRREPLFGFGDGDAPAGGVVGDLILAELANSEVL